MTGEAKFAVFDAQVRINAIGDPARGNFFLSQEGTFTVDGNVTCIRVVGNRAAVGGVIEHSSNPSLVGKGFVQFVEDNGSPGTNDFSQTNGLDGSLTPPGASCPAPIHPAFQVKQGNYVVKSAA